MLLARKGSLNSTICPETIVRLGTIHRITEFATTNTKKLITKISSLGKYILNCTIRATLVLQTDWHSNEMLQYLAKGYEHRHSYSITIFIVYYNQ
ncbi:MAG TPA: hypothetical protein VF884_09970 [Nitrososphaeraceae archaeon]